MKSKDWTLYAFRWRTPCVCPSAYPRLATPTCSDRSEVFAIEDVEKTIHQFIEAEAAHADFDRLDPIRPADVKRPDAMNIAIE